MCVFVCVCVHVCDMEFYLHKLKIILNYVKRPYFTVTKSEISFFIISLSYSFISEF